MNILNKPKNIPQTDKNMTVTIIGSNKITKLNKNKNKKKYNNNLSKKNKIPKKLREEVWMNYNGESFKNKCNVSWCSNIINVFNYHVGHDIPESKGGSLDIINLKPICSNCNLSMSNNFTITEWNKIGIDARDKIKSLKLYIKIMSLTLATVGCGLFIYFHGNYINNIL